MHLLKDLGNRPMFLIAAAILVLFGIAFAAWMTQGWCQALGGALAALGGALLSTTASDINVREKAVAHLKPELQSISRHLADTVTKISRNIQATESGTLDSDLAIDRVAQLKGSLYGAVNDLQLLVGVPPDFQGLIETVEKCENMAARLEQLTAVDQGDAPGKQQELDQLRGQLESARMQLVSAQREFGGVAVPKVDERVKCPSCGSNAEVKLGRKKGDSAFHWCSACGEGYHIHRDGQGGVFARPWGGGTELTRRLEVRCPACQHTVPLHFHLGRSHEDRICMQCASDLRITVGGEVTKIGVAAVVSARAVTSAGSMTFLECPACSSRCPVIWDRNEVSRAVCTSCHQLLESRTTTAGIVEEQSSEPARSAGPEEPVG